MDCYLKLKNNSSWIEITRIMKYANIIFGNVYYTDFIVENVYRYTVYLLIETNIVYQPKLNN